MKTMVRIATGLVAILGVATLAGCGGGHASVSTPPPGPTTTTVGTSSPSTTSPSGVVPPTVAAGGTTPSTTAAPSGPRPCVAGQLSVQVGPGSGAAGTVGYVNSFENVSNATCTLYGYPGMQMLDAAGRPIPTEVIRGSGYAVTALPEKVVTLAPGGKASFQLIFADGTGYGTATCPTSSQVEFTPPNLYVPITVSWQIQPYGGATIAQLHCGQITVSPVFSS